MESSTTTPTVVARPAPSTSFPRTPPNVRVGDVVLVTLEAGVRRPMLVTSTQVVPLYDRFTPTPDNDPTSSRHTRVGFRVSGTIFCEPDDHTRPAFRGWTAGGADPARLHGRPDRLLPLGYGELLACGDAVGQWQPQEGR